MRRFVLGWKMLGLERSLGTRIVTYADDLLILCRKGKAEEALLHLRALMPSPQPGMICSRGSSKSAFSAAA